MHAPASPWAPAAVAGYTTTRALKGMGSSEQNNSKSNRINNKRKTKDLATEYAKDVDGVKDVKNEMAVSAPAKKTQTAGDQIDDASITGGQDDATLSSLDQCPQYLGHNEEWCGHINRQGQKRKGDNLCR